MCVYGRNLSHVCVHVDVRYGQGRAAKWSRGGGAGSDGGRERRGEGRREILPRLFLRPHIIYIYIIQFGDYIYIHIFTRFGCPPAQLLHALAEPLLHPGSVCVCVCVCVRARARVSKSVVACPTPPIGGSGPV